MAWALQALVTLYKETLLQGVAQGKLNDEKV